MNFNFKKISAVLTSAVMLGSTLGIAAAANYPAPFVQGGAANVAIVYGNGAMASDAVQAGNIQSNLQSFMGSGSSGGSDSVSGEAFPLFTSSSKVYLNDTLNTVKTILTDTELPSVLMDGDLSGNVEADFTQTIKFSSNPRVVFGQHPTSDEDPVVAVQLGTTTANHIYNLTITFDRAVNFTSTDTEGETLSLFGQKVTVGAATDETDLVLYKSSDAISLSVGGADPSSQTVTVDGSEYTIELKSATDTSARIKVTDSAGGSQEKEINEGSTSKVQGIDVAVDFADESDATSSLSAVVLIGAEKIKLRNGAEVKIGSDETSVDGTNIDFVTTGSPTNITQIVIQVTAEDTDVDAIVEGGSFTDPVFGAFKVDFAGLNIPETSTSREVIEVKSSGNDKATVKFTNHDGTEKLVTWLYNASATARLADSSGDTISVREMQRVNKSDYLVVGNQDEGYLLEVKTISNDTTTATDSDVVFEDVFTGDTYTATITSDGAGSVTIGGKSYTVSYVDSKATADDEYVRLNYPDSPTAAGHMVIYPTIETSKGAKVAFYQPETINLMAWDGTNALTGMYFPDGDGYTTATFGAVNATSAYAITGAATDALETHNNAGVDSVKLTIGQLYYNLTVTGTTNQTTVYLLSPDGGNIVDPALIIFEEKDDSASSLYQAIVVTMDVGGTSADGVGVEDVEFTWGTDGQWDEIQLESDTDLYKSMNYWGTMVVTDRSESDQYTATISYPDEQVYPKLYVSEASATVTSGTSGGAAQLGEVVVKDSEAATMGNKNLVVVGGSCINSVAAQYLGAGCGADFTEKTGVSSGEFLLQSFSSTTSSGKVVLVVAGYDASDTANAAKYLTTQAVDTTAGKKYKGTTSTSATLVTS